MCTQAMQQKIADYFKTQPVLKVWLFGSYARGEETPESDIDLLVQFDHSSPIGLFAYARMHRELEEHYIRKTCLPWRKNCRFTREDVPVRDPRTPSS